MTPKDKELIARIKQKLGSDLFYIDDEDEPTDECVHFYFLANQQGEEVVCDCVLYTLRLHHESEMHEEAEARVAEKLEQYLKSKDSESANQEEEIGMMMAEILVELEEEEAIKVQEHVELDSANPAGLGIDVGLNVPVISNEVITKFISEFKAGTVRLDEALYSFQISADFE
ncbi:MAG: hypothetical protein E6Q41_04635 [Cyclobacteriaceae bacterium]|nr:MAG: hypothetical protein E6Q41_04635 [Cyclobacteriaceae bacterium]